MPDTMPESPGQRVNQSISLAYNVYKVLMYLRSNKSEVMENRALKKLMKLGFEEGNAIKALADNNNDVKEAAKMLLAAGSSAKKAPEGEDDKLRDQNDTGKGKPNKEKKEKKDKKEKKEKKDKKETSEPKAKKAKHDNNTNSGASDTKRQNSEEVQRTPEPKTNKACPDSSEKEPQGHKWTRNLNPDSLNKFFSKDTYAKMERVGTVASLAFTEPEDADEDAEHPPNVASGPPPGTGAASPSGPPPQLTGIPATPSPSPPSEQTAAPSATTEPALNVSTATAPSEASAPPDSTPGPKKAL